MPDPDHIARAKKGNGGSDRGWRFYLCLLYTSDAADE